MFKALAPDAGNDGGGVICFYCCPRLVVRRAGSSASLAGIGASERARRVVEFVNLLGQWQAIQFEKRFQYAKNTGSVRAEC